MELPHLNLYLRRLAAPLPWRRGIGAVLAEPRMWLYGGAGLWLGLGLLLVFGWPWISPHIGEPAYTLANSALVLLANVMVYYGACVTAAGIAAEPRAHRISAKAGGSDPLWYVSLLPSSTAVAGQVACALLGCLPVVLAVFAFSCLQQQLEQVELANYGYPFMDSETSWLSVLEYNLLYALRIPQLVLFTMALTVAARRSSLAAAVPWLPALAAALAAEAESQAMLPALATIRRDPFGPTSSASFWSILVGLGLLALLAYWLLRWLSSLERPSWRAHAAVLALCLLPIAAAALLIAEGWLGLGLFHPTTGIASVYHAFLATYLPDLHPIYLPGDGSGFVLYGWELPSFQGAFILLAGYGASLALWWNCAVHCLDAARKLSSRTNAPGP